MWRERDFEEWFVKHPFLPTDGRAGERVVVVARQQALRRVVDILCLDGEGGLVLIEIKNETSTRAVIGQALEYLGDYEGIELDGLLGDLTPEEAGNVRRDLRTAGFRLRELSQRRRIYLVARSFDFATQAAVSFLNDRFAKADLHLGLISAVRNDKTFRPSLVLPKRPKTIRELRGQCGMNPRERLYLVLPERTDGLVVSIGRVRKGKLHPPKGPAATQRLARKRTGRLIPYTGPFVPDTSDLGAVWAHTRRPRRAILLARVRPKGGEELVYYALEERGRLIGYRIRTLSKFRKWHEPAPRVEVSWQGLLNATV